MILYNKNPPERTFEFLKQAQMTLIIYSRRCLKPGAHLSLSAELSVTRDCCPISNSSFIFSYIRDSKLHITMHKITTKLQPFQ